MRLLAGRITSLVLTFIAWALIARTLSPGNFGFLQFGISVVFYLAFITDGGLTTLGTRELASSYDRSTLMRRVYGVRIIIGVMVFAVASVVALTVATDDFVVWLLLISTVGAASVNSVWALRALNRPTALAALDVVGAGLLFGGAVAVATAGAAVALAAIVYAAAQWMVAVLSLWMLPSPQWSRPMLRGGASLLRRAAPLGVAVLAINVYYSADSILLGVLRGGVEVGNYAAAYKLVLPWLLVASVVGLLAMPRLASDLAQKIDFRPLVTRMARLMITLGLTIAVGGTLLAPMLVSLVFGEAYEAAAQPLGILIWSAATVLTNAPFGFVMLARRQDRSYMWIAVAGAVLNLGLNLVLIPSLGMVGAAISTLAAEVLVLASILWATRDTSAEILAGALRDAIPVAALTGIAIWPVRDSPIAIGVGIVTFAVATMLTRVVTMEEVRGVMRKSTSTES